jgi:hypothetical protein
MYKSILSMLISLGLMACFPAPPDNGGGGGGGTPDAAGGNPCTRQSAGTGDGFPFDVATFDSMLYTPLKGCEIGSGCHGAGNSNRFTVYSTGDCPDIKTFNEVFGKSDYQQGGAASAIVKILDGTSGIPHTMDANLAGLLTSYIDTAKQTFDEGGGGGNDGGPGGGGGSFDPTVYANQIHPILTGSNCANSNCHNIDDGTNLGGGFGLHPRALAGSAEVTENIAAIAMRIDTSLPAAQANLTEFYDRCTDSHTGSVVGNPQAIEDWIAAGLTAAAIQ